MNPSSYPITPGTFESLDDLIVDLRPPADAMSKWVRNVRFGSRRVGFVMSAVRPLSP